MKILNEFTVGDEGNSSRESDQPLVGVLNVEQAAARLEIIYNLFFLVYFKTFSVKVKVDIPVRVCQWLQCSSGRTLQSLPEGHYK